MSAKPHLLKGRYTSTDSFAGELMGEVRYLNPINGELYGDPEGTRRSNSGFRCVGDSKWVSGVWEFTAGEAAAQAAPILGYVVSSSNGAPTVLHRTQEIAEAEALRLAQGNTGVEFTVHPAHAAAPVAKACAPKPVAKLEKL